MTDKTISRLWLNFNDEDYSDSVCLLLPKGQATLVDVSFFEWAKTIGWKVLGRSVFYSTYITGLKVAAYRQRLTGIHRVAITHGLDSIAAYNISRLLYKRDVDHINRNPWDNRRQNLRLATRSENLMNCAPCSGKSSKYKGVSKTTGKKQWQATINFEGNAYHLGTFKQESEAALAYNAFIKAHCPEFGYLNPIEGATADDHPTKVKVSPEKRKSKLVKLTPKELRVKKIEARIARSLRSEEKRRKIRAELMATKKPWKPGDPTWPPAFVVRLREPGKAVDHWGRSAPVPEKAVSQSTDY